VTNPVGYYTNTVEITTNEVVVYRTNTWHELHYAAGKSDIGGIPYVGAGELSDVTRLILFNDQNTNGHTYLYGMTPLCTNFARDVDILYYVGTPSNFPPTIGPSSVLAPWHGWQQGRPTNWNKYHTTATLSLGTWYSDIPIPPLEAGMAGHPQWFCETIQDTMTPSVWGTPISNDFGRDNLKFWQSTPPALTNVVLKGWRS